MRFFGRTALTLALLGAALVPGQVASAESPSGSPSESPSGSPSAARSDAPSGPSILARESRGQAALNSLGSRVSAAARLNGLSTAEFREALLEDPSRWVGRDGRMFYADTADEAGAAPVNEVSSASAALADTFTLHSRPSSQHVIYLDFGGITLASNSWWVTNTSLRAKTYTGYSQDSDPAFNDTEKTYIQQVWRIIAEKYAAFDVDVTTEDPGPDGYNRTGAGDPTWGDRVIFTSDDEALADACGSCAGQALIGVFDAVDSGQYEPAWVFTDVLGTSATLAANAGAHEVGHTLGLNHDGTLLNNYYSGHNHWVPVMGITNSRPVAQFSKGEYNGANNTENDLAVIAGNGAPVVADDHGNTTGTATALAAASSYEIDGVISSASDKDVFAVPRSCVNNLTATATGIGTGAALDIKLSVYNAAGALVGANDPASGSSGGAATGMNAEHTVVNAAASTYYVEIDGVGSGGLGNTPNPSTGYSDYGSIGQYHLAITGCAVSTPPSAPRNLTASPTPRSTQGSVSWSAPSSTGSGPITGYTVTGLPGGTVSLGPSTTSAASANLVPGTTYAVSVVATNAYGSSAPVSVDLRVPTWAPSAAPTVTANVTGKDAGASWTNVANPGNATVTGWSVVLKRGSTTVSSTTVAATPRSASFSNLAPGSYTLSVTVVATADDTTGRTAGTTGFAVDGEAPSAPRSLNATSAARSTSATLSWSPPSSPGDAAVTGYTVTGFPGAARTTTGTSLTASGLNPGTTYTLAVTAQNAYGDSPAGTTSHRLSTWAPSSAPAVVVTVSGSTAQISWTAPANPGNATPTGYAVHLTRPSGSTTSPRNLSAATTSTTWSGVPSGTWGVTVTPRFSADDTTGISPGQGSFTIAGKPDAPRIGKPTWGKRGGASTVIPRWAAPTSDGGSPITGYRLIAYKLTASNQIAKVYYSKTLGASARSYKWFLPTGRYQFKAIAINANGKSPKSDASPRAIAR